MNSINAKSVQLIELHAFAYCLLSVSLSESFDVDKDRTLILIGHQAGFCRVHQDDK